MSPTNAHFVSCPCQHCNDRIEFDASRFDKGETRTVECPHCHLETIIFVPQSPTPKPVQPASAPPPPLPTTPAPLESGSKKQAPTDSVLKKEAKAESPPARQVRQSTSGAEILLGVASVFLFVIGSGMVLNGCLGELQESTQAQGSAIRQGVYAVQYGSGFIVISLSVILGALVRLIGKV